ncbi:amidohydrolase [Ureibacillus massiliensis 4400831 = CIP 108448 = CCUG 49529]|uniref:Amidohydrolase n=1 Tax=Ureibacillus massiliensis 4400831 = CIP 108448 = CCUG 49529 TaxID=1211035 RepID=A0A0A3JY46_9BACL|nr:M20 family metallopeptidase [Ureibacillus massiliensis]KGR91917.1 amidohydrolase [Ureibacillus massiliensis 4400831 = CIP 108448 = CCUG 49529]
MEKKNLDLAIQLRHELHVHPELSYQEVWTKQHLIDFLKSHTSNLDIVDKGKYFYAIYRVGDDRPNIAFRADFDALPIPETIELPWGSQFPGIAHKCGHDGHSATLAGFALEVDQKGADNNIFFLFQHAEETGQGAYEAQEFIDDEKIDEIFGYHNMSGLQEGVVGVIDGTAHCASRGMSIKMIGSPSHASEPENGINPAYTISKVIDSIPQFTSAENNEGLVLCTIIQIDVGSENYGISAHEGTLRMTIRAEKEEELNQLQQNIEGLANKLCEEQGIKVSFTYHDEFPETVNHKESSDKIRGICKEKNLPLFELSKAYRPSEDYGYYLKKTKGAYCFIGNGEQYPALHTYEYDFRDENIEIGVELFKGLAGVK